MGEAKNSEMQKLHDVVMQKVMRYFEENESKIIAEHLGFHCANGKEQCENAIIDLVTLFTAVQFHAFALNIQLMKSDLYGFDMNELSLWHFYISNSCNPMPEIGLFLPNGLGIGIAHMNIDFDRLNRKDAYLARQLWQKKLQIIVEIAEKIAERELKETEKKSNAS